MVERIQQFVKDKSIIFVGNSVEIMEHKLADFIDSHDIVVRFGRAVEANKRHEQSVGKKTNIWITGQFRSHIHNKLYKEFTNGKFKDVEILLNRCRGNFHLKKWVLEDNLPKRMRYTQMYTDEEIFYIMRSFGVNINTLFKNVPLALTQLRPSAGFLTILWFVNRIKTYKSLDIIGFDFFSKSTKERKTDGNGFTSQCDPHSWHLPIYTTPTPAHDGRLEEQHISFLERNGKLKWHVLSDLKKGKIKYTNWMKGEKLIHSAQKRSKYVIAREKARRKEM